VLTEKKKTDTARGLSRPDETEQRVPPLDDGARRVYALQNCCMGHKKDPPGAEQEQAQGIRVRREHGRAEPEIPIGGPCSTKQEQVIGRPLHGLGGTHTAVKDGLPDRVVADEAGIAGKQAVTGKRDPG
jgi:hypothetical protein